MSSAHSSHGSPLVALASLDAAVNGQQCYELSPVPCHSHDRLEPAYYPRDVRLPTPTPIVLQNRDQVSSEAFTHLSLGGPWHRTQTTTPSRVPGCIRLSRDKIAW